ncbi:hypothetical protein [Croceimicrobium sp.]|uniref:hypothetical protein n=1 Tax=Croceimicrobium sp. TaxID=2828340 RepID=UPI003BA85C3A
MKLKLSLASLMLLLLSCQNSDVNKANALCISKKADELTLEYTDQPSYISMLGSFESDLISKHLLSARTQQAYIALVEEFWPYSEKLRLSFFDEKEKVENYSIVSGLVMMDVLFNCPYEALDSNDVHMKQVFSNRTKILNELSSKGYEDKALMMAYINSFEESDYEDISVRAAVLNIILYKVREKEGHRRS